MDESDKALIKGDSNNEFIDVVNYSIITNYSSGCINYWDRGYFSTTINTILHGNNPYPIISNGTALVTDTYLIDKFNLDDKNNILAGSLANCQNSTSLIITDLYADGIIEAYANNHVNLTYEQLIGKLYPLTTYVQKSLICSCSIGCIVKTNYKEKYKEIGWNCIVYWEHQVKSKDFTIDIILQDLNEWEFEDFTYNDFNGGWML